MNKCWRPHNLDPSWVLLPPLLVVAEEEGEADAGPGGGARHCCCSGGDHTHHSPPQQNHREGILAVYYQLLLKPIYTMAKRVLFLNLMDIKLCVAANGQKLGAALGILATLS